MNECQHSTLASPAFLCHYPSVTLAHLLDMGGLCKKQGLSSPALMWVHGLKSQIMLEGSSADKDLGARCSPSAQHWQSCIWRCVQCWASQWKRDRDILEYVQLKRERVQLKATEMTNGPELFSLEKRLWKSFDLARRESLGRSHQSI